MKFRDLTIRTKLTIAFVAMAAIVLLTSGLALRSLVRADDRFAQYLDGVHRRERLATDVRGAATRRAIAARNLVLVRLPADRAAEMAAVNVAHADTVAAIAALKDAIAKATDAVPRDLELFRTIESVEMRYSPVALGIAALATADRRDEAVARMNDECRPLLAQLLTATGDFVAHEQAQAQRLAESIEAESAHDRRVMIVASAAALIAAAGLGWLLSNAVTTPLRRALALAEAVAAGDLGTTIVVDRRDETGLLLGALQRMNQSLVGMVSRVRQSADSIATASSEIAHGNLDLSNRTELQASAVQQTAASMQQMMSRVRQNAEITREASTLADAAADVATRGGDVVQRVVATMADITDSSRRIADITGTIDSIAFQTNILSLNAAVEAARAGDQGRGFSIVATEVRRLAQRSAEAAKEIRALTQRGVETVTTGNHLVAEAGSTMRDVMRQVKGMTDLMSQLASSAGAQSDEITQVNQAVASIDHGTQSNAALVEEGAAAAESLRLQATGLMQAIAAFHVHRAAPMAAA